MISRLMGGEKGNDDEEDEEDEGEVLLCMFAYWY
jgi:hypothetical protein